MSTNHASRLYLLQIRGVQDLFVFDHGSFFADSNSSLGTDTAPGEYSLQSLHVQDRGVFELHSSKKDTASVLSLYNLTVRILQFERLLSKLPGQNSFSVTLLSHKMSFRPHDLCGSHIELELVSLFLLLLDLRWRAL